MNKTTTSLSLLTGFFVLAFAIAVIAQTEPTAITTTTPTAATGSDQTVTPTTNVPTQTPTSTSTTPKSLPGLNKLQRVLPRAARKEAKEAAKQLNIACMQSAVEKRDNTVISAVDSYQTSIKTALQTRLTALKTAWGISSAKERRAALKKAWDEFRITSKKAQLTARQSRQNAWQQFYTDRKACGSQGASDDPTTTGVDNNL